MKRNMDRQTISWPGRNGQRRTIRADFCKTGRTAETALAEGFPILSHGGEKILQQSARMSKCKMAACLKKSLRGPWIPNRPCRIPARLPRGPQRH